MSIHDHDDSGSQSDHDYYLGEEAFMTGFKAGIRAMQELTGVDTEDDGIFLQLAWDAWSAYEPSEDVKR